MSLFDQLGRSQTPAAPAQQGAAFSQRMTPEQQRQAMQADVSQIKADPAGFIRGRGLSIPSGMTDAGQITQYLLRSGQVGGPRYQQAVQLISRLMGR